MCEEISRLYVEKCSYCFLECPNMCRDFPYSMLSFQTVEKGLNCIERVSKIVFPFRLFRVF